MGLSVLGCAIPITKSRNTQRWPSIGRLLEMNSFAIFTSLPACEIHGTGWSPIISGQLSRSASWIGKNLRSEERRVGKECRYRLSRYHEKKNRKYTKDEDVKG